MPGRHPSPRRPGRPADPQLRQRRCEEILQAATDVFARRGFADTEVQVIADRLRVGKGTVYRYFSSKEKLFLAVVDRGMRQMKQAVDAATSQTSQPLQRVAAGIRAYLTFFDEHPHVVELLIHERALFRDRRKPTYFVHRETNVGRWRELFRQLIRDGVIRDIPVERITDVISGLLYGTMFTNYFAGRQKPLSSQCEDILDIVFRGLLVDREENLTR
jgi:AcrR family transcriptional regulator